MLVDAHTHFDFFKERDKLNKALSEVKEHQILSIACSMNYESFLYNLNLSKNNKNIIPCYGIHPWKIRKNTLKKIDESHFNNLIKETPMVGEIGLDFHWVKNKDLYRYQYEILELFFYYSKKHNKVVNLHTKGAEKEILYLLKKYDIENPIIHWYSGPKNLIKDFLDLNTYFTISVDIESKYTLDLIELVPLKNILTETDGPTALEWINGSTSYPVFIKNIVNKISNVKNKPINKVKNQIFKNLNSLIDIKEYV